jgi:hypothetical protein
VKNVKRFVEIAGLYAYLTKQPYFPLFYSFANQLFYLFDTAPQRRGNQRKITFLLWS